ncbi:hypothetical protein HK097_005802, partial [Rhizophlyctis rosea]
MIEGDKKVNSSKEGKGENYLRGLFRECEDCSGEKEYVLTSLPFLLQCYISARSRLHRPPPNASTFSPEFTFYSQLASPLSNHLTSLLSSEPKFDSKKVVKVLESWKGLVEELKRGNVYRGTRDARDGRVREGVERVCLQALDTASKLSGKYHSTIFEILEIMVGIDFTVVEESLDKIFPLLLTRHKSTPAAPSLINSLFETFTKGRTLDIFMSRILGALDGVDGMGVFGGGVCLERFGNCVSTLLPAQGMAVLKVLSDNILSSPSSSSDGDGDLTFTKKRKTSDSDSTAQHHPFNVGTIKKTLPFLQTFLKRARISEAQKASFLSIVSSLFTQFVQPVLTYPQSPAEETPRKKKRKTKDGDRAEVTERGNGGQREELV